jgi:transposase
VGAESRVAIGRKNGFFAGNDRAGTTAATLSTLIASAERHGIDPQAYFTSILARIAATAVSELEQLLPNVWTRDNQSESAKHPITPPGPSASA